MKKILTACLLLCFLAGCKKDVKELPPATATGANTFGAKVNGELWVPQGFGSIPANDILESLLYSNGDLRIKAQNFSSSPTETEFYIFVKGVTAPGTYLLNSNVIYPSTLASNAYYVKRKITPLNEWITSSSATGSVTITKVDAANHIVAGTFQFNAVNLSNPADILTVTEGRFDLKTQ
jgi:hypothetical protein